MYELVLVEWNPIEGVNMFHEEYDRFLPKNLSIKVITVPNNVHSKIENPYGLPLFEYYGKNVGARRSNGDFLIFTNPDNFFFPRTWVDIVDNISDDYFLRLCRADVRWDGNGIDFENYQSNLPNLLMRNHFHFYGVPGTSDKLTSSELDLVDKSFEWDIRHEGASGDFFGISKKNYYKINGYREFYTYSTYDGIIMKDSNSIGLRQIILPKYSIHIDHSRPHLNSVPYTNVDTAPINGTNWGFLNEDGIKIHTINK
jgi:hypothetical protein